MTPAQQTIDEFVANFTDVIATKVAAKLAQELPAPTRLLSVDQVGEALGITRRAAQDLIAAGRIESLTVGVKDGRRVVEQAAVDEYIARQRVASRAVPREDRSSREV